MCVWGGGGGWGGGYDRAIVCALVLFLNTKTFLSAAFHLLIDLG